MLCACLLLGLAACEPSHPDGTDRVGAGGGGTDGGRQVMVARHGTWKSPLTAAAVAAAAVKFNEVAVDGEDVYWIEERPSEGGRHVVVRRGADGRIVDVTPPPFNARTRVHEYGGGAFAVRRGTVYFSNFADQRLYRQAPGGAPQAITAGAGLFYADCVADPGRERLICVREDHTAAGRPPVNALVGVALGHTADGEVLASGTDFYSNPRLSPDGSRLAWLSWDHPNMPWDGTELWEAPVRADGSPSPARRVAGGESESIVQPEWSPDGSLYFVSDRSGWWNLYRLRGATVEPMHPMDAEFGRPQWTFGTSMYAFASAHRIVCSYTRDGRWHLARLDTETGRLEPIATPYEPYRAVRATATHALFVGVAPAEPEAVVRIDLASGASETIRSASERPLDAGYLSVPEHIEFPVGGGLKAHAFWYAPKNRDFTAPAGERAPLLVISHGGPTSAAHDGLDLKVQYWTSRGFGVVDVNYGGSTGYGRVYRERLKGQWGIVDVADCINAARYLVERGQADEARLIIRGGSAGGYTTLSALAFHDVFRAGASRFGVSDLEALARDTHKFESRYLDGLVGPYPARRDLYRARSPIHFADRLSCPLILFQGLEDRVVAPSQSETMADAVRAKGLPVAYLAFSGEQHGFRRVENIVRALEAELFFYGTVFGFSPADPIEPVRIDNLERWRGRPEGGMR